MKSPPSPRDRHLDATAARTQSVHAVSSRPLQPPWPQGFAEAIFAMGCFWGVEQLFWNTPGVWVSMAGYAGGDDQNPSYTSVCTGETGHAEAVRIVYDPAVISYAQLLQIFWESHNPTHGLRQGNDIGSQYRSMIFAIDDAQMRLALASRDSFQIQLDAKGLGEITTEIVTAEPFYYAEDYHQQYLAKNPEGYCNLEGTGVQCTI